MSEFSEEMIAIIMALQWIEEVKPIWGIVCTDSLSALQKLQTFSSRSRQDVVYEINYVVWIQNLRLHVRFVWVPAHLGIHRNELADRCAKQAPRSVIILLKANLDKIGNKKGKLEQYDRSNGRMKVKEEMYSVLIQMMVIWDKGKQ